MVGALGTRGSPRRRSVAALALGVFVKRAAPGEVKTRLAGALGAVAASDLYRQLVGDTIEVAVGLRRARLVAFFAPADARDACAELVALPPTPGRPSGRPRVSGSAPAEAILVPQSDGDLGSRMAAAFERLFADGAGRAILIGSDCPLVDRRLLETAGRLLGRHDLVLGPTADGGYWLIGLRAPQPTLFQGVRWSTPTVLETTLAHAQELGLSIARVAELSDLDTPVDLAGLEAALLAAWAAARDGKRDDFPLRTFRWLCWRPDRRSRVHGAAPAPERSP